MKFCYPWLKEGRRKFGNGFCNGCNGCNGCNRYQEEGSSATDSVTDVTDVTDVSPMEVGRGKKLQCIPDL
ncbi:hypothetical protein QUB14_08565 [Microcoleus sp. B3-D2]|uniref:hypothetical protein n=1 Tax=unclassified Microcoleus TaxID=2642155 RepID=UPI002FD4959E